MHKMTEILQPDQASLSSEREILGMPSYIIHFG